MRSSLVAVGVVLALACAHPARADDAAKLYDLAATAPKSLAKGATGTLSVKVTTKDGGEIHKGPPLNLTLSTPGHLALSKTKLGQADATFAKDGVSFAIPFTAQSAGKTSIEGKVRFYVCTAKSCTPQERQLSVPVRVR